MVERISALLAPLRRPLTHRQSIALVFCCTWLGAAAQVLMKMGAQRIPAAGIGGILTNPSSVVFNLPLLGGLGCYGLFTAALILALRDGELSVLYPIIALNYVWVTMLSLWLFSEHLNPLKSVGIAAIVLGVMVLGVKRS